jgi:hypothetical protein
MMSNAVLPAQSLRQIGVWSREEVLKKFRNCYTAVPSTRMLTQE